jgi:hypothetical protein
MKPGQDPCVYLRKVEKEMRKINDASFATGGTVGDPEISNLAFGRKVLGGLTSEYRETAQKFTKLLTKERQFSVKTLTKLTAALAADYGYVQGKHLEKKHLPVIGPRRDVKPGARSHDGGGKGFSGTCHACGKVGHRQVDCKASGGLLTMNHMDGKKPPGPKRGPTPPSGFGKKPVQIKCYNCQVR